MRDLDISAGVTLTTAVTPVSVTATGLIGSSMDTQGYEGVGELILTALNTAGTTPTLNIKIQDSADNSTFADASPSLALAQITSTGVVNNLALDFRQLRRYIQVYATIGGTASPAFTVGAGVLARKKYL